MMIELRIIDFVMNESGKAETEALVASMMMDNWTIQSFQVTDPGGDLLQSGVFVMVRDVEPVVEAVDDEFQNSLEILFDILSRNSNAGALRPGMLWQVQYALVAVAKWLLAHGVPDTSMLGVEAKDYIKDIETRAHAGTLPVHAKNVHAMYQKIQKAGEQ